MLALLFVLTVYAATTNGNDDPFGGECPPGLHSTFGETMKDLLVKLRTNKNTVLTYNCVFEHEAELANKRCLSSVEDIFYEYDPRVGDALQTRSVYHQMKSTKLEEEFIQLVYAAKDLVNGSMIGCAVGTNRCTPASKHRVMCKYSIPSLPKKDEVETVTQIPRRSRRQTNTAASILSFGSTVAIAIAVVFSF